MRRVDSFVEEYKANFDAEPGILAATGYDTIKYLMEVIADEDVRTRRTLQKALLIITISMALLEVYHLIPMARWKRNHFF